MEKHGTTLGPCPRLSNNVFWMPLGSHIDSALVLWARGARAPHICSRRSNILKWRSFLANARTVRNMFWGSVQQPNPSQMSIVFVFISKSLARVCNHMVYLWLYVMFLNARLNWERQSLLPGFPPNVARASFPCRICWAMLSLLEMMCILSENVTDIEIECCF